MEMGGGLVEEGEHRKEGDHTLGEPVGGEEQEKIGARGDGRRTTDPRHGRIPAAQPSALVSTTCTRTISPAPWNSPGLTLIPPRQVLLCRRGHLGFQGKELVREATRPPIPPGQAVPGCAVLTDSRSPRSSMFTDRQSVLVPWAGILLGPVIAQRA